MNRLRWMRVGVVIAAVLCVLCPGAVTDLYAQGDKSTDARGQMNPKLDKAKPGVYLTYSDEDRPSLKTQPNREDYAWLRLYNNLIWDITLCRYDFAPAQRDVVGLHYEMKLHESSLLTVESSGNEKDEKPTNAKVFPRGLPAYDFCSEYVLKSGSSVLFPARPEHFVKNALLTVTFFYEWENVDRAFTGGEPMHKVYLYSTELVRRQKSISK